MKTQKYEARAGESIHSASETTVKMARENSCDVEFDFNGIKLVATGFMYGAAVSVLAAVWVHGEALRLWHNLKTQIGNEGEKANDSGGVLNPAILKMG